MNNDLISKSELIEKIKDSIQWFGKPEKVECANQIIELISHQPTVEQPQDNLNEDEKRLIGEAVNYLLGAELVEENGWSKEDVNILHSLCMKFYGEDYN